MTVAAHAQTCAPMLDLALPDGAFSALKRYPGNYAVRLEEASAIGMAAQLCHRSGANVLEASAIIITTAQDRPIAIPLDRRNFRCSLSYGRSIPPAILDIWSDRKIPLTLVYCRQTSGILLGRAAGKPDAAWRMLISGDWSAHQRLSLRAAMAEPAARLVAGFEPRTGQARP